MGQKGDGWVIRVNFFEKADSEMRLNETMEGL